MKGLPPLPIEIPWEVQLILWAALILIGLLGALVIYFIKRYIDKNDSHHLTVESTLARHAADAKETSKNFSALSTKISEEAVKIDRASADMRRMQADFQVQVNKELVDIHKATSQIKSDLTAGNSQVGLLKKDIEGLVETVGKHQKSLALGAQAITRQREKIDGIQTEIVKINEELILVRDIKKKT